MKTKFAIVIMLCLAKVAFSQGLLMVTPEPKQVTYIAVMAVKVADPIRSYAVYCTIPGCNTVYTTEYRYIPFASSADVLDYLNYTKDVFVRLLTVKDAPVIAKETVTPVHHPDTGDKSVHYSLEK